MRAFERFGRFWAKLSALFRCLLGPTTTLVSIDWSAGSVSQFGQLGLLVDMFPFRFPSFDVVVIAVVGIGMDVGVREVCCHKVPLFWSVGQLMSVGQFGWLGGSFQFISVRSLSPRWLPSESELVLEFVRSSCRDH